MYAEVLSSFYIGQYLLFISHMLTVYCIYISRGESKMVLSAIEE